MEKREKQKENNKKTADRWKQMRNEAGLTQEAFSKMIQVPLRTYQEWEQGRQNPPEYFYHICRRVLSSTRTMPKDKKHDDSES